MNIERMLILPLIMLGALTCTGCLRTELRDARLNYELDECIREGEWDRSEKLIQEVSEGLPPEGIATKLSAGKIALLVRAYSEMGDHETAFSIGDAYGIRLQSLIQKHRGGKLPAIMTPGGTMDTERQELANAGMVYRAYLESALRTGDLPRFDQARNLIREARTVRDSLYPDKTYGTDYDDYTEVQEVRRMVLMNEGKQAEEKLREIAGHLGKKSRDFSEGILKDQYRVDLLNTGFQLGDAALIRAHVDVCDSRVKLPFLLNVGAVAVSPIFIILGGDEGFHAVPMVYNLLSGGARIPYVQDKTCYLGYADYLEKNWPQAVLNLEQYVSKQELKPEQRAGEFLWRAYDALGDAHEQLGNPDQGLAFYLKAVHAAEIERSSLRKDSFKRRFLIDRARPYERASCLLAAKGEVERAFEIAEKTKARALADLLEGKEVGKTQEVEAGYLAFRREGILKPSIDYDVALSANSKSAIAARKAEYDAVLNNFSQGDKELASFITAQSSSWGELGPLFGEVTLVEFFLGNEEGLAFVGQGPQAGGQAGQLRVVTIKTPRADIFRMVQEFRVSVLSGDSDSKEKGRALYDLLLRPAFPDGVPTRMAIVPHGPLHTLPFAALHDGQGWLIEKSEISTLPAAGVLPYCRQKLGRPRNTALVFGNPDLTQTLPSISQRQWSLPSAEQEAQTVARMFGTGTTVLIGANATEEAFREKAPQADIVHLACHGQFDDLSPSRSALLMAAGAGQDGRLESWEIMKTSLNASFVVMSACETALGEISAGDDVVGLTRGMLYAGTPSLMSTLWQVSDAATAEVMVAFYQRLRAGERPTEALRQAQLQLVGKVGTGTLVRRNVGIGLDQAEGESQTPYSHPYFWAPFVVVGDWQ